MKTKHTFYLLDSLLGSSSNELKELLERSILKRVSEEISSYTFIDLNDNDKELLKISRCYLIQQVTYLNTMYLKVNWDINGEVIKSDSGLFSDGEYTKLVTVSKRDKIKMHVDESEIKDKYKFSLELGNYLISEKKNLRTTPMLIK
jgi:hypothetical protein